MNVCPAPGVEESVDVVSAPFVSTQNAARMLNAVASVGGGCVGSAGTPTLSSCSPPVLGTQFCLTLNDVPLVPFAVPVLVVGLPLPAPVDLGFLGAPGCNLYTNPLVLNLFTFPVSSWQWTVPVSFLGGPIRFQAWMSDPGWNPGGFILSNAVDVVFGT